MNEMNSRQSYAVVFTFRGEEGIYGPFHSYRNAMEVYERFKEDTGYSNVQIATLDVELPKTYVLMHTTTHDNRGYPHTQLRLFFSQAEADAYVASEKPKSFKEFYLNEHEAMDWVNKNGGFVYGSE
jgi:hypothetical protein